MQCRGPLCRIPEALLALRRCRGAGCAYSTSATAEAPVVGGQEEPILAACVLQRLPVVRTPMSQEHRKLEAEERERALNTGEAKDYPKLEIAGRDESKKDKQEMRTFTPVPAHTAADASGDVRSMRRRLAESLYLVVRPKAEAGVGAEAAGGGSEAAGGEAGAGAAGAAQGGWTFPQERNKAGESLSSTAQRALFSSLSRSHPVMWVGNAPMAHLHAQPDGKLFFMLAQVVDDPWDTRPAAGAGAQEYAWVTKQELLNGYLSDARLRELVSKML